MKSTRTKAGRLGTYLTITVGAGTFAGTADAAIVNLDIGPSGLDIGGVNGGVVDGGAKTINPFPGGGKLDLYHEQKYKGFDGDDGLVFAINGNFASPRNFAANAVIGDSVPLWSGNGVYSVFNSVDDESPDFGANSFMGFRTPNGNYGWLEVTWDSATDEFEILSGAYENVPSVAILAGAMAAVPEPASVLGTIGLLAGGAFVRRRKVAA
jgi:hypothetical protein